MNNGTNHLMSNTELEQSVLDIGLSTKLGSVPFVDAAPFFVAIKKLAEFQQQPPQETASPDTSGETQIQVQHDEVSPPQAAAAPMSMDPESFTAPVEQVINVMIQAVANEFKTQMAYVVYANTLRDLSRHGIAEEFESHAGNELEHAKYLLRRLSVLSPQGVQLPPAEPPPPSSDPHQIIQTMIEYEQQGLITWRQLQQMVGENPTKYTIEQFLMQEQEHLDELQQLLPQTQGPQQVEQQKISKLIQAVRKVKKANANILPTVPTELLIANEQAGRSHEMMGAAQTMMGQAQQQQIMMQSVQMQNQSLQGALQQAQMNESQLTQQMQQQQLQASDAESRAQQSTEAYMRMKMRVDQLRQTLAQLASMDPAMEPGEAPMPEAAQSAPEVPQPGQGYPDQQQTQQGQQMAAQGQQQQGAEAQGQPGQGGQSQPQGQSGSSGGPPKKDSDGDGKKDKKVTVTVGGGGSK